MKQSPVFFSLVKNVIVLFIILLFSNPLFSKDFDEIISDKAKFILHVAKYVNYNSNANSKNYIIALYGRDFETRSLFTELTKTTQNLKINRKSIVVKLFKNMRAVKAVDIVYISSLAKIRLKDLHQKLSENQYTMITESYPFASSPVNFSFDANDSLIYEIQTSTLQKNGAIISEEFIENESRISSLSEWNTKIENKNSKKEEVNYSYSGLQKHDSMVVDTVIIEKFEGPRLGGDCCQAIIRCNTDKEKSIANAQRKFNWLLGISILVIIFLASYIFKLRRR